jgi:hypothetical protein
MEESGSSQSSLPSQQELQEAAAPAPEQQQQQQQQMIFMYDTNGQLVAVPNPFAAIGPPATSGFTYPDIFSGTTLSQAQIAQQAAAFAAAQQQFWAQAASLNPNLNAPSTQTQTAVEQSFSPTANTNTAHNISSPLTTSNGLQLPASFIVNNQFPQVSTALQSQQTAFSGQTSQGSNPIQTQSVSMVGQPGQFNTSQPIPSNIAMPVHASQPPGITGRPSAILYLTCDDDSLSDYQCLVRKQIELFEALDDDVESNAQGRNKPIVIGQVGIRCRHCATLPPRHRARGATYYPAKLDGLYQAAQNMASSHLCSHCQLIPPAVRQELLVLRDRKSSAGGGKKYWADGVRALGVYEDADVLRFERR